MSLRVRRARLVAATLTLLGVPLACGSWQATRTPQMESHADADATYAATRQVVADGKYTVVEQKDAERKIKVRSHVDEDSTSTQFLHHDTDDCRRESHVHAFRVPRETRRSHPPETQQRD